MIRGLELIANEVPSKLITLFPMNKDCQSFFCTYLHMICNCIDIIDEFNETVLADLKQLLFY